MTTSQKKIQKIFDLWERIPNVPSIAKITKLDDNTVRKILRKNGLLPSCYKPSRYIQQGLPKLVENINNNQGYQQQSPYKDYKLLVSLKEGPKLVTEFNKRNLENDQLKKKLAEVTSDLGKKEEEIRRSTEKDAQHITEIVSLKQQIKELGTKLGELKLENVKMKQKHQKELAEEKSKGEEEKKHEILEIKKETLKTVLKLNDGLETVKHDYNLLMKAHEEKKEENWQLKQENFNLQQEQSNSWLKYGISLGVGTFIGTGVGWWCWGRNKKQPSLVIVESGKITATSVIPISEEVCINPDIRVVSSGMIPDANTMSALCSGSYPSSKGETCNIGCATLSNEQDAGFHSPFKSINSGVDLVSTVSVSGCLGVYVSSHLENKPIQDAQVINTFPPPFFSSNYHISHIPPNDPLDSPL